MGIDRIVHFRPRTIFAILGILLAVGIVLYVVYVARHVLSWVLIALFLTLALNPAVEILQRRGLRRGLAVGITFVAALAAVAGLAEARPVMFSLTAVPAPDVVLRVTVDVATPSAASGSLNVTVTVSPASALPAVPPDLFVEEISVGTGEAASAGIVEANEA